MVILETKDLKKQYGTGDTAVHALAGVNLSVELQVPENPPCCICWVD